jgi:hypothetical protein
MDVHQYDADIDSKNISAWRTSGVHYVLWA